LSQKYPAIRHCERSEAIPKKISHLQTMWRLLPKGHNTAPAVGAGVTTIIFEMNCRLALHCII